jgi:hypothetical protein
MVPDTVLDLVEIGVSPHSARGITQTIAPITSGDLRRTVNGALVDLTRPSLRKYRSEIRGSDLWPPAFGGLWVGQLVTVHCAAELTQAASTPLERPAVPGSVVYRDAEGNSLSDSTGAAWVTYRPILSCRVVRWDVERDEWGEIVSWSLSLEEA